MITKIFEIVTKTGAAEKDIKNLSKGVDKLNDTLDTSNKEVSDLKKGGKAFDGLKKGAKGAAGGFKAMGTALKAAGIGLAIAAFMKLKELFEQNQKVVDFFNIAFESLSLIFSDFFNYLNNNIGTVIDYFKAIFEDPVGSLKEFGAAIKANIIERFNSALEVLGYLGTAIKKVFEGDFDGAMEAAKEAGKELVDVYTGVDNSVEKITEVVSTGVTSLKNYAKSTIKAAAANVELQNKAELAAVAAQGLVEKYDLQAEKLRQIRDEERNSIEDRKKANDELLDVLDKQEAAMLATAGAILKAAQVDLAKDRNNIESKKAVMEAENELAAVRATVAGFRSEQLANDLALDREAKEMINSKLEAEANLSIEQKRFNAEQIQDNLQRLEKQKEIDAEEKEIQVKRLQEVVNAANEGTQARIDAEVALNEFLEQSRQQSVVREKEIINEKEKDFLEFVETKKGLENEYTNSLLSNQIQEENAVKSKYDNLIQQAILFGEDTKILEEARQSELQQIEKDFAEQNRQARLKEANSRLEIASQATQAVQSLGDAVFAHRMKNLKEGTKEQLKAAKQQFNFNKALQLGMAVIDTGKAITASLAQSPVAIGPIPNPAGIASLAFAAISGASQIAMIASQKYEAPKKSTTTSSPPSIGGGGGASASQAPNFNVVGQSGFNQVAGALGSQPPAQAFVVSGDVTTAQQLENNTIQQATF